MPGGVYRQLPGTCLLLGVEALRFQVGFCLTWRNRYPGVWFKHNGNRIKILEAEISENLGKKGEVITNDLIIGCKDKSIKINLLQREGKTALSTKSFLAGYKIVKGDMLI